MILDLCAGSGMLPLALAEALPSELGDEVFSVRYAVPRDRASQRVLEAHEYRCAPAWDHPTIPLDDVDVVCASGAFFRQPATGPADYGAVEPLAALLAVHRPRIVVWAIPESVATRGMGLEGRLVADEFQRVMATVSYDVRWCRADAVAVGACHRRHWRFALGVRAEESRFAYAPGGPQGCRSKLKLVATPRPNDGQRSAAPRRRGRRPGRFRDTALPVQLAHAAKGDQGLFATIFRAALARHTKLVGRPFDIVSDMLDRGREIRPEFYEWLMDWPQDWAVPAGDRAARIRICGGGVMAAQAVAAFEHLAKFVKVPR